MQERTQPVDSLDTAAPLLAEERPAELARLTVSDGFRFGCGFVLAGAAFTFVASILLAAVFLVSIVLGIGLPFGVSGGR